MLRKRFSRITENLPRIALVILGIGIVWFIGSRFSAIVGGPSLVSYTVTPDTEAPALLSLQGVTKHVARITVNGYPVIPATDGGFEHMLLVPYGYSTITIHAEDKFGKNITETLPIYTDEPPDLTSIATHTESSEPDEDNEIEEETTLTS